MKAEVYQTKPYKENIFAPGVEPQPMHLITHRRYEVVEKVNIN